MIIHLPFFTIVSHFMKTFDDILFDLVWRDINLDTEMWNFVTLWSLQNLILNCKSIIKISIAFRG